MEPRNIEKLIDDFTVVEQDCLRLYTAKTHDYGNSFDEAMNKLGLSYAVGRLYDKMNRLVNLCGKEDSAQVKDESLDDTLMDLANYAIMTLSYRRNAKNKFEGYIQEDVKKQLGIKVIHKKTGKPYLVITDKFKFKQDGKWIKNLVLYVALYANPDGRYFARTKEDFEDNFEIKMNNND